MLAKSISKRPKTYNRASAEVKAYAKVLKNTTDLTYE